MKPSATLEREDAYAIELSEPARQMLATLPKSSRMSILGRLAEIAHVAATLRSWMAGEVSSTLHFELAGHAVSYVMSDARRKMQVLGVIPAERGASQPGARQSSPGAVPRAQRSP